ncbi:YtxH domain-containing protein [Aureibacter tunicatorum]|uniref:Gas vesicle protein n=1 Tax=Aureibacter tunicatorum TaxID=866807 RepID=A0AAE4BQ20_9BACT|nr:YtxH domain-containing protein [Aureibacter tunicatorum]MDR6238629.1 gas vesicle protein [Aureibacter tunicatorum]BDD05440.1 hypothetical protein AUTU_29230 [Aureibacter tunicatorum]
MSKKTNALLAFLTGAAAGAILGVLYAPEEGSSTRDKLSYKLSKTRDKLKALIDELISDIDSPNSLAKTQGDQVVNQTREKAERLLGDVDDLISQIKGDQSSEQNSVNN